MNFKYTINLPSVGDVLASEITTGQQKEYLKALLQPGNYEFCRSLYLLLQETLDVDISKLTLVDKMVALLKLREMSIGGKVEYSFECESCKKHLKHILELGTLLSTLSKTKFSEPIIVAHESCSVVLGLPTIETELAIEKENGIILGANELETYNNLYIRNILLFTHSITIGGISIIQLQKLSIPERIMIIEKLPAKLSKIMFEKIQEIKKDIAVQILNVDCLCGNKVIVSHLSIDTDDYTNFLKSIYNENLHNVYQNIYYMTSMLSFTPEYVEKMTPNERELYWSYYHKDQKKKQEEEEDRALTNQSTM